MWTDQGRAEVLGTIFTSDNPGWPLKMYHEMHSLSSIPLNGTRNEKSHWKLTKPGVKPAPFPKVSVPAGSRLRRSSQMKTLVRRFSGHSVNYDKKEWSLRLLPQPLYRMPKSTDKMLDSAVFAFVSTAGTDPEVLIVIDAPVKDGNASWQYSVYRFTDLKTWVSLDNEQVWAFTKGSTDPTVDAGPTNRYRFTREGTVELPSD